MASKFGDEKRTMQACGISTARGFAATSGSILFDTPTKRIWQRNSCSNTSALLKILIAWGFQCSVAWLRRARRHNQEFCETLKHREADSDRTRKASDDVGADRVRLLNKITFVAVPECNSHVRHH